MTANRSVAQTLSRRARWLAAAFAVALLAPAPTAHAKAGGDREAPGAAAPGAPGLARPIGAALPVPYAGSATQLVTVRADCRTCTDGTLQAWVRTAPGRWLPVGDAVRAKLGEDGVGPASEFTAATPLGTWDLTQAFGRQPDPGTALPWFTTDGNDWWDGRSGLATYNTHVRSSTPIDGENLLATGWVYDYALVIGANPQRIPYGGSAYFLHLTDGRPTLGCVAIPQAPLLALLRWLTPAAHPQIVITVG